MYKIYIVGNFLLITDEATGLDVVERPAADVKFTIPEGGDTLRVHDRTKRDAEGLPFFEASVADCIDENDAPFGAEGLKNFSRLNLAFSKAGPSASPTEPVLPLNGAGTDDGTTLDVATGSLFVLTTPGARAVTGEATNRIDVHNDTDEPIDVAGVPIEPRSASTLFRDTVAGPFKKFGVALVLFFLMFVGGASAQVRPQVMTTAEREALTLSADASRIVYDSDLGALQHWDGAAWAPLGSAPASEGVTVAAEGLIVDAAEPWTEGLTLRNDVEGNVETGLNLLTDVDFIDVSFARSINTNGSILWAKEVKRIRVADIVRGVPQGVLLTHHDAQFLAITSATDTTLEAGTIRFRSESNVSTFGYVITRIEFKKRVDVAGSIIEGTEYPFGEYDTPTVLNNNVVAVDTGIDLTDAHRIELSFSVNATSGQTSIASALVSDIELDEPNGALFHWWDNVFIRLRLNSDDVADGVLRFSSHNSGAGFVINRITVYKRAVAGVIPMAGGESGATLNSAIAITSVQVEAPANETELPFESFTSLSGDVTANAALTRFTLPQSDILYAVHGTAGVDLDGNPGGAEWSIELWDVDAGERLPGSTNATASVFAVTGTQSGYQYYQPNMVAIVDASAGDVTIGMVVLTSGTGAGGNTLDILDRSLEIEQKSTAQISAVPLDISQIESDVERLNSFYDTPAMGVVSAGPTQNAATATIPAIRSGDTTFTPTPGVEYTLTHAGKGLSGANNTAIFYLDNAAGERIFDTLGARITAGNPTREHTYTFTETDGEITVSFQSGGGSSAASHELAFTVAGEVPPPVKGLDIRFFGNTDTGAVASDFFQDSGNFQMQLRNSTGTIQIYRATIPNVEYARIPHLEPNLYTLVTTANEDGTYNHTFSGWLPALVAGQPQSGSIRILGGVPLGNGLGSGEQDQLIIQSKSAFAP